MKSLTLALCGDVMTGRGIDQILKFPSEPLLHETFIQDSRDYVKLAERANGPIPRRVDPSYIWGDALRELERRKPDARIINLETAITVSENWEAKGINYRMNPKNIDCLNVAQIDCAVLANNHVLDWGEEGLLETLDSLKSAGIPVAGAGRNLSEAQAPAIMDRGALGRILVIGLGSPTSGIGANWAATEVRAGMNYLRDLSDVGVERLQAQIERVKKRGDFVVVSIHWGENWGYEISRREMEFAHALIDEAGVDMVHGHSSHHAKGFEIYHGKLILYGCGDLITDYEGIEGHESFRGELGILYFARIECETGKLIAIEMLPFLMKRFRLEKAGSEDVRWIRDVFVREMRGEKAEIQVRRDEMVITL